VTTRASEPRDAGIEFVPVRVDVSREFSPQRTFVELRGLEREMRRHRPIRAKLRQSQAKERLTT
jgi:hypothetical protein